MKRTRRDGGRLCTRIFIFLVDFLDFLVIFRIFLDFRSFPGWFCVRSPSHVLRFRFCHFFVFSYFFVNFLLSLLFSCIILAFIFFLVVFCLLSSFQVWSLEICTFYFIFVFLVDHRFIGSFLSFFCFLLLFSFGFVSSLRLRSGVWGFLTPNMFYRFTFT